MLKTNESFLARNINNCSSESLMLMQQTSQNQGKKRNPFIQTSAEIHIKNDEANI